LNKQFSSFSFFHPNLSVFLKVTALNIVVLFFFRIFFLVKHFSFFNEIRLLEIFLTFLNGLRFDISTTFLIFAVFYIALFLPAQWTSSGIFRRSFRYISAVLISLEMSVLIIDNIYYGYVNRHLAGEITQLAHDKTATVYMVLHTYYAGLIVWIILTAGIVYILKKILKEKNKVVCKNRIFPGLGDIGRSIAYFFILTIVSAVSIRGGFQSKPLRVSNAFINDSIVLGHLSLNGVYTMMNAIYKKGDMTDVPYEYSLAVKNMRSILNRPGTKFLDENYPLFRTSPAKTVSRKINVVIFIMESWSADSVGSLGGEYDLTPNFDRLASKGALFTNFFAVGQRSVDAALSILFSFPSFAGMQTSGKVYEQNQMIGLAKILRKEDYSTIFVCAANRGSMGFDSLAKKCGFEKYIAKDDFDLPKECYDGTWGVFDEYAFLRANEEFKKAEKPFLGVIYSLNPHAPYKIPSEQFVKIKKGKDAPFYNALYYTDWALGQFMKAAEQSDYARNTLFIIVGDHPEGHHEQTIYDSFRIPCLFYFPGNITAEKFNFPASQLDIFPTVMDIAGIAAPQACLGKSLFRKNKKFAFVSNGNVFGWLKGDYAFLRTINMPVGFYNYRNDRSFKNNLVDGKREWEDYDTELLSALKLSAVMLKDNKIAPVQY